jgi:DNA-binding transcriptional regulator YiaG
METKKVLTRENIPTDELQEIVEKVYKGVKLQYNEVYYLDYIVDEDTGLINKDVKEKNYTKNQMERNIKALKNAYHIAKGSASPSEIVHFREKYNISASTFSLILGFSKNTISNIDKFEFSGYAEGRDKFNLIVLNKKYLPDEPFAVSTIAHEALHITSFVMKRVGMHPDVNNDEAQAYLLSWIVEQVYKEFKKS